MITYRPFCNTDPPLLAAVWSDALGGRGSYPLRSPTALDRGAFSKSYFDPTGLVVAVDGSTPVGFAHAGFGVNHEETSLNHGIGVVCVVVVRPSHRNQGIGSELLKRAEQYLREHGASKALGGSARPHNPFYLGVYGGSDSPGVLASDPLGAPFFMKRGYSPLGEKRIVWQRRLDQPLVVGDPRMINHRKRFELVSHSGSGLSTWWQENTVGLIEPVEFRLMDKQTNAPAARAVLWELDGFATRWGAPSAGIYSLTVKQDMRGQGIGKFFLAQLLRYLQDQYFGICECHTDEKHVPAHKLARSVGFEPVDEGQVFSKAL